MLTNWIEKYIQEYIKLKKKIGLLQFKKPSCPALSDEWQQSSPIYNFCATTQLQFDIRPQFTISMPPLVCDCF
jgi:hypothetical protein